MPARRRAPRPAAAPAWRGAPPPSDRPPPPQRFRGRAARRAPRSGTSESLRRAPAARRGLCREAAPTARWRAPRSAAVGRVAGGSTCWTAGEGAGGASLWRAASTAAPTVRARETAAAGRRAGGRRPAARARSRRMSGTTAFTSARGRRVPASIFLHVLGCARRVPFAILETLDRLMPVFDANVFRFQPSARRITSRVNLISSRSSSGMSVAMSLRPLMGKVAPSVGSSVKFLGPAGTILPGQTLTRPCWPRRSCLERSLYVPSACPP